MEKPPPDESNGSLHTSTEYGLGPFEDNFNANSSEVKLFGCSIHKNTFIFIQLYVILIIMLVAGGAVFYALEYPEAVKEIEKQKLQYEQQKNQIIEMLFEDSSSQNMTATMELYERLKDYTLGFQDGPNEINNWNFSTSIIFAFTIITTIGYGTFTPSTDYGQIFVVVYGLIGIPITALALGSIAERVLYFFTWLSKLGKDNVLEAFNCFDADGSGELEKEEFEAAVTKLGFSFSTEEFEVFWNQVDREGNGTVDVDEFRAAVKLMHADLTEAGSEKFKIMIILLVILSWLVFGVLVFIYVEKWSVGETVYFLFVSLATIGLGDFTPNTKFGSAFLVAFSFVGLGLVAILITFIQNLFGKIEQNRKKVIHKKREIKSCIKRLKQITQFEFLSKSELKSLAEKSKRIDGFQKIIIEGEELKSVYILVHGSVKARKANSNNTKILSVPSIIFESTDLGEGDFYLAEETVETAQKATVISVPCDQWKALNLNMSKTKHEKIKDINQSSSENESIKTYDIASEQKSHYGAKAVLESSLDTVELILH